MKNIPKLTSLILAISAIHVVSGQISNPEQKFGSSSNSVPDNFGNTETCQRISKCQQYGPIICCPPICSSPPQGGGTMGGQVGGNGQNKQNEENENIQKRSVSQRKCLQNYPPLPIVQKEETIFNITGGERTYPGEYPYMAAIGWENEEGGYDFKCDGFLVEKKFVVTTAHCTTKQRGISPTLVRLGGTNLNTGVDIKISRTISHPNNTMMKFYTDIAVIQLESEVTNRPVCLWPSDKINFEEATVIGYGSTEYDSTIRNKLKKAKLSIYSNEECSQYYEPVHRLENGLDQSQLCAGDRNGVSDTCKGDAGGPLLVTSLEHLQIIPYVIGITSFGPMNCGGNIPTIFTRISSFIPWIESVVWPNEF